MHVILFTDITNSIIPVKTIGAYKIANVLRQNGYKTLVINDINYIVQNRMDELFAFLDTIVTDETLYFGFSSTFLSVIKDKDGDFLVSAVGNTLWSDKTYKRPYDYDEDEIPQNFSLNEKFAIFLVRIKKYNKKIVMGGANHTAYLINNLIKPDHWIQGLAETSIIQFTKDLKKGKDIPQLYKYDRFATLYDFHNTSGTFSHEDFVLDYETLPIEFSRGCRFKCKFCSYPLLGRSPKDNRYVKSEEAIYQELKYNYENFGVENYYFLCDTFNETTDKIRMTKNAIHRAGINPKFFSYLRIELLHKNPEQISILRDMGIGAAHFGIESLNYNAAKSIGKGLDPEQILKTVDKCRDSWGNETVIHGSFIIGLPHDSPEKCDVWTKNLRNASTSLTSVTIKPLAISQKIKDENMFYSEFEQNMEKYGYKSYNDNWINEHWTYDEACEYAKKLTEDCWNTRQYGMIPFNALMYLSADFSWKEIVTVRKGYDMFDRMRYEAIIRGNEKRNEYIDKLLNTSY
jgi:radical SAM superfamily enzyme YgiQ (UPF0313 family)